jgi:hypothetical protein
VHDLALVLVDIDQLAGEGAVLHEGLQKPAGGCESRFILLWCINPPDANAALIGDEGIAVNDPFELQCLKGGLRFRHFLNFGTSRIFHRAGLKQILMALNGLFFGVCREGNEEKQGQ